MDHRNVPKVVRLLLLDRLLCRVDGALQSPFLYPLEDLPDEVLSIHDGAVSLGRMLHPKMLECLRDEGRYSLRKQVERFGVPAGIIVWRTVAEANATLRMIDDVNSRAAYLQQHPDEGELEFQAVLRADRRFRGWLAIFEILYIPGFLLSWGVDALKEGAPWWDGRRPGK